jgi:hypothetical protein
MDSTKVIIRATVRCFYCYLSIKEDGDMKWVPTKEDAKIFNNIQEATDLINSNDAFFRRTLLIEDSLIAELEIIKI